MRIHHLLHLFILLMGVFLVACGGGHGNSAQQSTIMVSTIAGAIPGADGIGASADFGHSGLAMVDGQLYLADAEHGTIRKIDMATRQVTTFAGSTGIKGDTDGIGAAARFYSPAGIATDGKNLFVSDARRYTIRKIEIATATVTTLAGKAGESASLDGVGSASRFLSPSKIACDGTFLYVLDGSIRKISIATGEVSTLNLINQGNEDAVLWGAAAITFDSGNLYVAEESGAIRKIVIASGAISTFAGSRTIRDSVDGAASDARFDHLSGITSDGTSLYVTEGWNSTIRKIMLDTGEVSTLAGKLDARRCVDGVGLEAEFYAPGDIVTDGSNLYVSDNRSIRKINLSSSEVSTIAGADQSADGIGNAARFEEPNSIATDGANLFIFDSASYTIRKMDIASGQVTTLAGHDEQSGILDDIGLAARFWGHGGITSDGANLFVSDRVHIHKFVVATGEISTLAGGISLSAEIDGAGSEARLSFPAGIVSDGTHLFVADSGHHVIRKIVIATGVVTTLAGKAGEEGANDGSASEARFSNPKGLSTDGCYLYVVDSGNFTLRKIEIASGQVSTLAGLAGQGGFADGIGQAARFWFPEGISKDGTYLYVTDSWNNSIRKVAIATGAVSTLAGSSGEYGNIDGSAAQARFYHPTGIVYHKKNLYVADLYNHSIRKISLEADSQ